jgi:hypothetical protein
MEKSFPASKLNVSFSVGISVLECTTALFLPPTPLYKEYLSVICLDIIKSWSVINNRQRTVKGKSKVVPVLN